MNQINQEEKGSEKKSTIKKKNVLKKLDLESVKLLASLKDKANKKAYGRKVRDSEVIAKGLSLIEQQHLVELQEITLSEKDRLYMAHEEYSKQNGKVSLDQFIGRLLKGEINISGNEDLSS